MKVRFLVPFVALAAALSLGLRASAATKVVTLTGTLNAVNQTAPFFDSSVAVGTPYTLSFRLDTAAPDLSPGNPNSGVYFSTGSPYTISAAFGNYVFSTTDTEVFVRSGFVGQYLLAFVNQKAFTQHGLSVPSSGFQSYIGSFDSTSQPVIPNDSLSNVQQNPLSAYPERQFAVLGTFNGGADSASVTGSVTGYTVTTIAAAPEPSSIALACACLTLVGIGRRRSRIR